MSKMLVTVLLVILIGILGIGGYWIWRGNTSGLDDKRDVASDSSFSDAAGAAVLDSRPAEEASAVVPVSSATGRDAIGDENLDSDDDGLTDAQETHQTLTDPSNSDTDGDGLTDGDEFAVWMTNPRKVDTDADGLLDEEEINIERRNRAWHTDPNNPDTDGDGFPDGIEVKSGYNPSGGARS